MMSMICQKGFNFLFKQKNTFFKNDNKKLIYKPFQMSGIMLSPKVQRIQRSIRINDGQLLGLAEKARFDSRLAGFLYKRCADNNKWLLRWFRLYQVCTN